MIALQYNNYRLSITNYKKIKIVNYKFGGSIEMKANLPEKNFFDSFYIWFNKEKREEYYSTPLYLYNVLRKDTDKENDEEKKRDETRVYLKLEKDISKTKLNRKKEIIKHPSTIYIHYAESIGMLLINFLNADFFFSRYRL